MAAVRSDKASLFARWECEGGGVILQLKLKKILGKRQAAL